MSLFALRILECSNFIFQNSNYFHLLTKYGNLCESRFSAIYFGSLFENKCLRWVYAVTLYGISPNCCESKSKRSVWTFIFIAHL